MWRKEQHFITAVKSSNCFPLVNNSDSQGPWCEDPQTQQRSLQYQCANSNVYGGKEFDVFDSDDNPARSNDDKKSRDEYRCCCTDSHLGVSPASMDDDDTVASIRTTKPSIPCSETSINESFSNNKRKANDRHSSRKLTNGIKHHRSSTYPTSLSPPTTNTCNPVVSRTSRLGTHFYFHTSPSGIPIDLFKPSHDNSNCFCTQHTIYS